MRRYSVLFALIFAAPALADEPKKAGPDWWSLQPVVRPALPKVKNRDWPRNPIDVLILAKLEAASLKPAPEAEPHRLLRRLYFDVLGLPPSPEEIDEFLRQYSGSPQAAVEKVVDRLLASPLYGERWARHWLDVVRFAESQGFERDKIRDHAWRYRDYVIDSFNRDKPYDQFIREQLAGDVLPNATASSIIATGFLVAGPFDEAGTSSASPIVRGRVREEEMEDMLAAVGQTFLGLTVNCARCHDHKFDPIPQRDYYRIKAVFDSVRHGDRALTTKDESRLRAEKIEALERQISEKEKNIDELEKLARESMPAAKKEQLSVAVPMPIGRWTFQTGTRDSIGGMHGTLHGNAIIRNGRLILDGKGSYMETKPLANDLREKTLEAWGALADKTQRGGSVMSVQAKGGEPFDAIVFGERQLGKWMAGSDFFRRTRDHNGDNESAKATDLIHLVIVYANDGTITMFRNGKQYFQYKPQGGQAGLASYAADTAEVLFGLRHTGAVNGYFAGEIEEARLYAAALVPAQIRTSYEHGFSTAMQADFEAALIPFYRQQYRQRLSQLKELREERSRLQTESSFAYAANIHKSGATQILLRGDIEKPGDVVKPGGLSALPNSDFGLSVLCPDTERRLKFAEWVASPENPLTARVIVNRLWHYHFGRGLVGTPNDFGFNGERPSHPALLDWLACEFGMRNAECGMRNKREWDLEHQANPTIDFDISHLSASLVNSEFRIPNSEFRSGKPPPLALPAQAPRSRSRARWHACGEWAAAACRRRTRIPAIQSDGFQFIVLRSH